MNCKDCKYWNGAKEVDGRECTEPHNQMKWQSKEQLYTALGYGNPEVRAKYKYASAPACKHFEARFSGNKIVIEHCYMVNLVNSNGEVVKSEMCMGKKSDAHELGDKMLMEVKNG